MVCEEITRIITEPEQVSDVSVYPDAVVGGRTIVSYDEE